MQMTTAEIPAWAAAPCSAHQPDVLVNEEEGPRCCPAELPGHTLHMCEIQLTTV